MPSGCQSALKNDPRKGLDARAETHPWRGDSGQTAQFAVTAGQLKRWSRPMSFRIPSRRSRC